MAKFILQNILKIIETHAKIYEKVKKKVILLVPHMCFSCYIMLFADSKGTSELNGGKLRKNQSILMNLVFNCCEYYFQFLKQSSFFHLNPVHTQKSSEIQKYTFGTFI